MGHIQVTLAVTGTVFHFRHSLRRCCQSQKSAEKEWEALEQSRLAQLDEHYRRQGYQAGKTTGGERRC